MPSFQNELAAAWGVAQGRAEDTTAKTIGGTEAEPIAFVVGTTIGLQTRHASADYIHLEHGNAALLAENLEVIQCTSPFFKLILATIEAPAGEQTEAGSMVAEVI